MVQTSHPFLAGVALVVHGKHLYKCLWLKSYHGGPSSHLDLSNLSFYTINFVVDQYLSAWLSVTFICGHPTLIAEPGWWLDLCEEQRRRQQPSLPTGHSWWGDWSTFKAFELKVGFEIDATKKDGKALLTQVGQELRRQSMGVDWGHWPRETTGRQWCRVPFYIPEGSTLDETRRDFVQNWARKEGEDFVEYIPRYRSLLRMPSKICQIPSLCLQSCMDGTYPPWEWTLSCLMWRISRQEHHPTSSLTSRTRSRPCGVAVVWPRKTRTGYGGNHLAKTISLNKNNKGWVSMMWGKSMSPIWMTLWIKTRSNLKIKPWCPFPFDRTPGS